MRSFGELTVMSSKTIDVEIAILLEKAQAVMVKSDFERKVLQDLIDAFAMYGFKAVVTPAQLKLIGELADRFDATHRQVVRVVIDKSD